MRAGTWDHLVQPSTVGRGGWPRLADRSESRRGLRGQRMVAVCIRTCCPAPGWERSGALITGMRRSQASSTAPPLGPRAAGSLGGSPAGRICHRSSPGARLLGDGAELMHPSTRRKIRGPERASAEPRCAGRGIIRSHPRQGVAPGGVRASGPGRDARAPGDRELHHDCRSCKREHAMRRILRVRFPSDTLDEQAAFQCGWVRLPEQLRKRPCDAW
jgi:hypothetical protein